MKEPSAVVPPNRGLLRYLYDFWAKPIRAEPLALFRMVIGSILLLSLLTSLGPRLPRDFGPDGLYPASVRDDGLRWNGGFCLLRGPVNLPLLEDYLPADVVAAWRGLVRSTGARLPVVRRPGRGDGVPDAGILDSDDHGRRLGALRQLQPAP